MGRRGPRCTVCAHRERAAIDVAIARGVSLNAIAKRAGLGPDSLARHSRHHLLPPQRAKLIAGPDLSIDLPRLRETESQSLLLHLVSLRHRLFATLDQMEEHADGHGLATISSQLHKNLELTAKLLGDLNTGSTTINNVLVLPEYVALRIALVDALAPFPAARQAVAAVLHRIEHTAADAIRADPRQMAKALPEPITIEQDPTPAQPPPPPPC